MKRLFYPLLLLLVAVGCSEYNPTDVEVSSDNTDGMTRCDSATSLIEQKVVPEMEKRLKNYDLNWGVIAIMDVESGYTRTINCSAYDDKVGDADSLYSHTPIEQGGIYRVLSLMPLLQDKGVKVTDPIDCGSGRKMVGEFRISDPIRLGETTVGEAIVAHSNIAVAELHHQKAGAQSREEVWGSIGYYKEYSLVEVLGAYNRMAQSIKSDNNEPKEMLDGYMATHETIETCWDLMKESAQIRKIDDCALYMGAVQLSYGAWDRVYAVTTIGFYPADDPQYTVLVSHSGRFPHYWINYTIFSDIAGLLKEM